ncbi:MAG: Asp-tRNA(Asn)/Glu-tRNA(Gln) amidotransferase subunit GatB [Clostridiales bacterium]|nr:Asp-tRNA(Asn)/Glu-tRNA(Gln) amidotransferase subunit GatB [Clostridiales bacterium]
MNWEVVIGLETHVELATRTKIFCGCSTEFGGAPNTHVCPVCTGMPGTLPVMNKKVLEYAAKASLALNCTVTQYCKFDRKNYFYPDLPKAYQVSQLYLPIGRNGSVPIRVGSEEKVIRIHELHMEEDAGKLVHDNWIDQTRADYNRCGVPLIEIVTEPDFRSADEVIAYLEKLRSTLEYLGVSDCKMQEGSLRCDVNLSVRPQGSDELGTRTEMKNLNSFKAISRAIAYEARRQEERIELDHKRVIQETRRWDDNKDATYSMRSKENAQDYRYFPEPDIPPMELSDAYLDALRQAMPEMAEAKRARYQAQWGLSARDAELLTSSRAMAAFFEETVAAGASPKQTSDWIQGEVLRELKERSLDVKEMIFAPENLAKLIGLVSSGRLNRGSAARVLRGCFADNADVEDYMCRNGLEQVNDTGLLEEAVTAVLAENPQSVADYRAGKKKAVGFLMGQCMKRLKGKGDPKAVSALLNQKLES